MAQMARNPITPTDAPTATAVLFFEGLAVADGMDAAADADAAPLAVGRLEPVAEEHCDNGETGQSPKSLSRVRLPFVYWG